MGLSSRLIRGAALDKRIIVNNEPVRMNYVLKANDNILINLKKKESQNIEPEKIDIWGYSGHNNICHGTGG